MIMKRKKILAVGAHPDDIEFMCSGTLKVLKEKGCAITLLVLANGDCGSMDEPPERIVGIRREEALEAAGMLGAEFHSAEEWDLQLEFDNKTKKKVTEYIRVIDPDIVFTHPHQDYMVDHEVTSRLVRTACFAAPVPNYATGFDSPKPRTVHIPYLYYWSPLDGYDMYGDFVEQKIYVNVTSVIDFKSDMLACHRSQREWLMKQHGMDKYVETMRGTARTYGKEAGFEYAEGFTQHRGNAYPRENVLGEILGELVKEKVRTGNDA